MRRSLALLALVALAACGSGGSDPVAPTPPRYPDVAGTYSVTGTIDQLPATQASIAGAFTIVQPDRNLPAITIVLAMTSRVQTSTFAFTGTRSATLNDAGYFVFNVGEPGSTTTWDFRGTISGKAITGDHLLIGSGSTFTGRWSATRP